MIHPKLLFRVYKPNLMVQIHVFCGDIFSSWPTIAATHRQSSHSKQDKIFLRNFKNNKID